MAKQIEAGEEPTPAATPEPTPPPQPEPLPEGIPEDDVVQPVARGEVLRRRSGVRLGTPQAPPPPLPDLNSTPAQRIAGVGQHSNSYLTEFRLRMLHRLLMRNLPLDMIAAQLGCSVVTVRELRNELQRRLAYEAQHVNRYEIAGKTMAFYDEIQGMALRMADDGQARPHTRLTALQTALAAQADRQRFLTASGFWAAAPFQPQDAIEDESSRAANKIQALIEAVIDDRGETVIDDEATDENARQAGMDDKVKLL